MNFDYTFIMKVLKLLVNYYGYLVVKIFHMVFILMNYYWNVHKSIIHSGWDLS